MAVREVTRRGKKVWRARIISNGKAITAFRRTRRAALAAERELHAKAADVARANESPTVAAFAARWIGKVDAECSINTAYEYRRRLEGHILPDMGHMPIGDVDSATLQAYVEAKTRGLSRRTVKAHLATMRAMLAHAHELGLIARVPRVPTMRIPDDEPDYLSFDEAARVIDAAGEDRPLMLIAIRTGLRLGELRGLQWGDIDLEGRRIRVARQIGRFGIGPTKSGRARTVDIDRDVVAELARIRPKGAGRHDHVWSLTASQITHKCEAVCKRAGIDRRITPHKLRHTFASHHAMRGTPLPVIQAWLGHASITTTMVYAHLCPSETGKWADMDQRGGVIGPRSGATASVTDPEIGD